MKYFIKEQPQTIRNVIAGIYGEIDKVLSVTGVRFRAIYLVGSGSSLNAAYAAKGIFEQHSGALVQIMTPFDFLNYYSETQLDSGSLVIGISQTARSIGTIESIKKAKRCGCMTVFVTAEPQNPGAQAAHIIFNSCTGEELVGAKTKGYTSIMAALFCLAAAFSGQRFDLSDVPRQMEAALSQTQAQIERLVEAFASAPSFTVVGYGPSMATVLEGGLKILETVRVPTERYDVEEYMHGPYHCLEDASHLIFIAPEGAGQERMERLIRFCEEITKHTLVIGNTSFVQRVARNNAIELPDGIPEQYAPLSNIIPLQWLANDVTLHKGRKPEASRYPMFHKMLGSKFMPPVNYYTGSSETQE